MDSSCREGETTESTEKYETNLTKKHSFKKTSPNHKTVRTNEHGQDIN